MMEESVATSHAMGFKERLVWVLGILPQNLLSFLVGAAVRIQCPSLIQRTINSGFVGLFKINMEEAEKPLAAYRSIEDVFTRALAPGRRQITGQYVSSADGVLEMSRAVIGRQQAIQAKGISYSLSELVLGNKQGQINASWYTTVYLAPHNYHRVHSPFSGQVIGLRYVPGRLWPVNRPAVRSIPGLFIQNERLVFDVKLATGGMAWVVMVGAFNVGRMSTKLCPEFVTNAARRLFASASDLAQDLSFKSPQPVSAGDELGVFMLGSTTVVILDSEARAALNPKEVLTPEKVFMGQSLSR